MNKAQLPTRNKKHRAESAKFERYNNQQKAWYLKR